MIDIHSHIIFDVDDGPKTLEDSLQLIAESYRQGVRTIVATSHRRKGMFETPEEKIWSNFEQVKNAVKMQFPDLRLCYGGELFYTEDLLAQISNKEIPSINDSRFYLIEFSKRSSWWEIHTAIKSLLALGITPVIAHIERYDALAFDEEKIRMLINLGCYTQINSAHVLKAKLFGDSRKEFKQRASYFLKEDVVHFVASDMHNLENRKPYMQQAYQVVSKRFGESKAKQLFCQYPESLLKNSYLSL